MTVLYVEKRPGFRTREAALTADIRDILGVHAVSSLRLLERYDIDDVPHEVLARARATILADPVTDVVHERIDPESGETAFAYAYHRGQFDQRADSAAQALSLIAGTSPPAVRTATVVILRGELGPTDIEVIQRHLVNPVDSELVALDPRQVVSRPDGEKTGRSDRSETDAVDLETLRQPEARRAVSEHLGLAMSEPDLDLVCAHFFETEGRPPTHTELAVIDTYWSDHCRHTTFLTELSAIVFEDDEAGVAPVQRAYERYRKLREELGLTGAETLMDMATIGGRAFGARGLLDDLEQSEEVNAASLRVSGPGGEPWLLMFKNETHNHPTEIEPFGGASTCLGGAIRDPLSGRSYVFQAARVTGGADPRTPVSQTLAGKLPQRTLATEAARGFSSYGNQIGIATGLVDEVYHPGYVAKRLEVGAVCGAAPAEQVRRDRPAVGDQILLVGGRTGRDGCGGATGSSKAHTEASIEQAGAEVQKGNPPVERALQRLFRRADAAPLIKRCNDFGAGGVSVAVGELADGVEILLDRIPVKYHGLSDTELAISESQERMAVVVSPSETAAFIRSAEEENLEATPIATVTDTGRMRMYARGRLVVDIPRSFLEQNGAPRTARALVRGRASQPSTSAVHRAGTAALDREGWLRRLQSLDVASRRGLAEAFDPTIGAGTLLLPFGGRFGATPEEAAVCELPAAAFGRSPVEVPVSALSYGFDPEIASASPYRGAYIAVVESVCRLVAVGADPSAIRLSLQEYFPRPDAVAERWGLPVAALLGALSAQLDLGVPAVGGKDSMSGSFRELDVPPTLLSFAVSSFEASRVTGAALREQGSEVLLFETPVDEHGIPDAAAILEHAAALCRLRDAGSLRAAGSVRAGGLVAALSRACLGNRIGIALEDDILDERFAAPRYGSFYAEVAPGDAAEVLRSAGVRSVGTTGGDRIRTGSWEIPLEEVAGALERPLSSVFPLRTPHTAPRTPGGAQAGETRRPASPAEAARTAPPAARHGAIARPKVVIPVFPGTNCETDTARAFSEAGAEVEELVFRNVRPELTEQSVHALAAAVSRAQVLAIAGGFSAGDEPDGSGKYIAAVLRSPQVAEAVMNLISWRDGLVLGICNGFQALVRVGLVPYGEIRTREPNDPILAPNLIGRHVATMVRTRVTSRSSPWLAAADHGMPYPVPVSHGEGRFVCGAELLRSLWGNGQIATQYVDYNAEPRHEMPWNPNGSVDAVEAVSSPDGRVLGKMGHSERMRPGLYRNFPETGSMGIFESGVRYFR